eukprot:TRINITY_DN5015_c0_g1_i4.p1 TRINITY_DN5015_c0_g1~~TRINITY_DN5015_c0_g1_i4.p1  ORF type:complete len:375 (+),score=77.00 TRINITY_DN5015_c0_g1_i4:325-1449(+)
MLCVGCVGLYIGGRLAHSGNNVVFIGRQRYKQQFDETGLTLSSFDGEKVTISAEKYIFETDGSVLRNFPDLRCVIITVKSKDTAELQHHLATLPTNVQIVSLQNGVQNADELQRLLPQHQVIGGMISFNVADLGGGEIHRGVSGPLCFDTRLDKATIDALRSALFDVHLVDPADMKAVQWGKLVLNLNNPVHALSGLPLKQQLSQRNYRRVLAALELEALRVLKAAGIKTIVFLPTPLWMVPHVMRLPDMLFAVAARKTLNMSEKARGSMQDDLRLGRTTEIDYLNGAIQQLGRVHNIPTPVNDVIIGLIKREELKRAQGQPPPSMSAEQVLQTVQRVAPRSVKPVVWWMWLLAAAVIVKLLLKYSIAWDQGKV